MPIRVVGPREARRVGPGTPFVNTASHSPADWSRERHLHTLGPGGGRALPGCWHPHGRVIP